MGDFITELTTAVTPTALWDNLTPVAALVGVLIIFAFGYYVLRKVVKGAGRGKPTV